MDLKKSTACIVSISSRAAATASGEGVCERAGSATDKHTVSQMTNIQAGLRMKTLLLDQYRVAANSRSSSQP
jgi:hypothetical protein